MPKRDIGQIPRLMRDILERGAGEFRPLLKRASLGEGAVLILCGPGQAPVGSTAAFCIEHLLERPAMVRSLPVADHYSIYGVGARSTVFVLPGAAGSEEGLDVLKRARNRGAVVWAFAGAEDEMLVKLAHAVVPLERREEAAESPLPLLAQHSAVAWFLANAAQILKAPSKRVQECVRELEMLPDRMEWLFANLKDATAQLAHELDLRERVLIVGGGAFYGAALQSAMDLREGFGIESAGADVTEFGSGGLPYSLRDCVVLFLSGSRCAIKKDIQEAASRARIEGAEIFSLTDTNDRELVARSTRSVLIPTLPELPAALLALTLAGWVGLLGMEKAGTRGAPPGSQARPGAE